ncbi:DUF418 domain-containing protein [Streptomyces sp. NPDC048442]|uniref:DUF418 domain-containing protein n=1 Tax=Streptomyces sp. NPDC048442 TaxID=3154823 RepID=UPI00341F2224
MTKIATGSAAGTAAGVVRTGGGRLPLLDVLRGAAILGTLMTNVWIFTSPGSEWGILQGGMDSPLTDGTFGGAAEGIFRLFADGKFLSMLTVLFGVGLAIQYGSAQRRGERWPGRYKWRALFLFAEGTVHFVFVFAWDVLMGYAVTALVVAWTLTRTERFRRVVMWVAGSLHVVGMGLLTVVLATTGDGSGSSSGSSSGSGEPVDAEVVRLYADGGYLEQIAFRLQHAIVLRLEPVLTFSLLVLLFLLGVRLFRAGAFGADAAGREIRGRMARWGLGVGVPLTVAAGVGGADFLLIERYVAAPVLAVGYMGLVGVVLDRVRGDGVLVTGLSAVGRTALSCYVLQNVVCVVVAYGFGLGLAERFAGGGPWWVMGLWAAVSGGLMVGASLWLRRFRKGPLEGVQGWVLGR